MLIDKLAVLGTTVLVGGAFINGKVMESLWIMAFALFLRYYTFRN